MLTGGMQYIINPKQDKIFVDNCFVMRTNVYMINRFSLLVLSPVSWFR